MPLGPPLPKLCIKWGPNDPTQCMERLLNLANELLEKYNEIEEMLKE